MCRVLVVLVLVVTAHCCGVLSTAATDTIYTSNADLQTLLLTNSELVKQLREYISHEEQRLQKVRRYLDMFTSLLEAGVSDGDAFVGNPINAFVLIKRLTSDFRDVQSLVTATSGEKLLERISLTRKRLLWPTEEDLSGAAVGLFRLQDTYILPTEDVARGLLRGRRYSSTLSAHDRFELGRQAYMASRDGMTTAWMEQALAALDQNDDDDDKDLRVETLEYMAYTEYLMNNVTGALYLTQKVLHLQAGHDKANNNKAFFEGLLNDKEEKETENSGDETCPAETTTKETAPKRNKIHDTYQRLCRGEYSIEEDHRSKLGCRYLHGLNPFLKYAPHKEEDVFLDPRIVIYHDVIYDSEIEVVKNLSMPKLMRSGVQNNTSGETIQTYYRISESAWLPNTSHAAIARVYRRVGEVTGLNMESSEEMQIAHYGVGGHYEPHYDFSLPDQKHDFHRFGSGNRMATWLFYASDVAQGGATVFPVLGVGVRPAKGAAVFWYNLLRNGDGDTRTLHAACPVLVGNKWVSNFWIHERGQERTRPCGFNQDQ